MRLWKKRQKSLPTEPVRYPAGIGLSTPSGDYFLNKDGRRYKFPTKKVFDSWALPLVVTTSDIAVSKYPVAVTKMSFRDGSLLHNIVNGRMYLVTGGALCQIVAPETLEKLGLTMNDATVVGQADVAHMKIRKDPA